MDATLLNVLIFGAHPDDADFKAGGVTALYSRQGHRVKLVSSPTATPVTMRWGAHRRRGDARKRRQQGQR